MIEYPKIETLWNRNPDNMKLVMPGKLRKQEFGMVNRWHVTEKVDGTNIRVTYKGDHTVTINGRTDNAQLHPALITHLQDLFPCYKFENAFDLCGPGASVFTATIYGEAYGPKVQSGGWYRNDWGFRVFDIRVGDWWLNWEDVDEITLKMRVQTVPVLGLWVSTEDAVALVHTDSWVQSLEKPGTPARKHEGVIARTDPGLLDRRGNRIMWKLKVRDLE